MVFAIMLAPTHGKGTASKSRTDRCSNRALKEMLTSAHPAAMQLEQTLACLGKSADRPLAAQAAYEIALSFAGANGDRPADFRTAAQWARKSAEYLKTVHEPKLRNGTMLAAIRLDYYSASTTAELRQVTQSLEQYYASTCAAPPLDEHCAESLKLLGEAERDLSSRGLPRAQASIDAFRRYLSTDAGKVRGPDRASALLDKGTLIAQAPEGALPEEQAGEAESALREAAEILRDNRRQLAQLNLAAFLGTHRSDRTDSLDEAETLLRGLLAQKLAPSYAFTAQRNLGSILFKKQTGNHQKNLSEAITVLDVAYASVSPRDKSAWIKTGISLALALEASGIGVPANLERAKKLLEELLAAADSPRMARDAAEIIETLVSVRLHRLALGEDESLDDIGAQLTRAQNASAGAPPLTRARLFALSSDYFSVKAKNGDAAALDKSIQELRQAIDLTDRRLAGGLWATFQNNLGNRCNNRKRPDLASCAETAYSDALTERTAARMPREHADTLVNLANLRFSRGNWPGASDLYTQVAELSQASFDPALGQDVLRFDAARSDRWFERAAYALARTGKISEAITLADQGRLRVLKQRLSALPAPQSGGPKEVSFEKLLTAHSIVLMPIVTTAGCVVFVAALKDGKVALQPVFLDEFDGDRVARFLEDRWLQAYHSVFEADPPDAAGDRWNATIAEVGDWLGASFFGPLLPTLEGAGLWPREEVVLVVQGELSLLPLHVGKEPTGKPLMNVASVSYLPSLALWQPRAVEAATSAKLYSIADPSDDSGLPYAPTEARVSAVLGGVTLAGPVDKGQFLQALEQADILHFVGHARFDADNAERSSIRLSSTDRLEVRDIETAQIRKAPDLIVLSACETGRVETATMANEFVGLPAAFMSIGAKGVISSLWPASDGPTLFLMARLMRELHSGTPPSRALKDAQAWLSNSTGTQLADVLRTLGPTPGSDAASLEQILRIRYRNSRPYAEPWAWAGFVYTGFKP